ncbi:MAG: hypothetical protein WBO36_12920, partial [Saprospiraceae bacterium]
SGNYTFNADNVTAGIVSGQDYYIGLDEGYYNAVTKNYIIGGVPYILTSHIAAFPNLNSDPNGSVLACDKGLIKLNVDVTQHGFDIGLRSLDPCSIKISKKVLNTKAVKISEEISFEITVLNQGGSSVSAIEISDRLPTGYLFSAIANPGWTLTDGVLTKTINKLISSGEKASEILILTFDSKAAVIQFTNEVRISKISDALGNVLTNINTCIVAPEDGVDSDLPQVCDLALVHRPDSQPVYTPDTKVTFTTTVCNQGTIDAMSYQITNYINPEFDFDPSDNLGWSIPDIEGITTYDEDKILIPGACKEYRITFTILEGVTVSEIINYAEISQGACFETPDNFDFDSTPDKLKGNDVGGTINTPTDNMTSDHGEIDEDDHDPAVIKLEQLDLSIVKTASGRRFNPGDIVTYNLKITNEGKMPISRVRLVDYLAEHLELVDQTWQLENGYAYKEVIFDGNLQPNEIYNVNITCRIKLSAVHPLLIKNTAEIVKMYDQYNRDVSRFDTDSTPDNIRNNDTNENNKDLTEDDISSVTVYLICPIDYEVCSSCIRGTTPDNGQFKIFLKLAASAGEDWYVESSEGLFDPSSPLPPGVPIKLADGYPLVIDPLLTTPEHVYYVLNAIHIDKHGFSVRLRNKFGDLEQITEAGNVCTFNNINVNGPRSLCVGSIAKYTATSTEPGISYVWSVNNDTILGVNGPILDFDWSAFVPGVYQVQVSAVSGCVAPAIITVALGVADNSSIACIGDFNVSMDGSCTMTITPSMMATGPLNPLSPYTVMLTDVHGNAIPNATLTSVHVGTKVMAKLIEGCGGNSCWATITVEDKMAPTSICKDISLPCYKLSEYQGPFERDNCGGPINNVIVSEKITTLTCDPSFIKLIDRIYQATDKYGNKSALCSMMISVERPNFDLIKFPPNWLMVKDSALFCNRYEVDANGHPSPNTTGVPFIGLTSLYPSIDAVCSLHTYYTDKDFGYIGCKRKIVRTWYVYE